MAKLSGAARGACWVLAAVLSGCFGSAGNATPPANALFSAAHARRFPTPSKVVRIDTYRIDTGNTVRVDGELTVYASVQVAIDGKIQLEPGATVRFFTDTFALGPQGRIAESTETGQQRGDAGVDLISACSLSIEGSVVLNPGDNLELSSSGKPKPCNTHITGSIGLPNGWDGSSELPTWHNGESGGYIDIGTDRAIAHANAVAKADGEAWHAEQPFSVTVSNIVDAGGGGFGLDDKNGKKDAGDTTYTFSPGRGGDGGSIAIVTDRYSGGGSGSNGQLRAGTGGRGGDAGAAFRYGGPDGTAAHPNAWAITIYQAGGGTGGSVSVTSSERPAVHPHYLAGSGGWAGTLAAMIYAGNGYAPSGGNGGNVWLRIGLVGSPGTGTVNMMPASDGGYYGGNFYAGNGGSALGPVYSSVTGGNGASFTLTKPASVTVPELLKLGGIKVALSYFGSGGTGTGVCPSAPAAGPNGGNGGSLHDNDMLKLLTLSNTNFDAGNGGAGTPGGTAGLPGQDDEGQVIGQPGQTGSTC